MFLGRKKQRTCTHAHTRTHSSSTGCPETVGLCDGRDSCNFYSTVRLALTFRGGLFSVLKSFLDYDPGRGHEDHDGYNVYDPGRYMVRGMCMDLKNIVFIQ